MVNGSAKTLLRTERAAGYGLTVLMTLMLPGDMVIIYDKGI